MEAESQPPRGGDSATSSLNARISALGLARDAVSTKPVRDAFASTGALLVTIKVGFLKFWSLSVDDWLI